jgi:hypothetical protein
VALRGLAEDTNSSQRRNPLKTAVMGIAPALCVSLTSPKAFFAAVEFAGAYPVALLWGLAPPLAALRLRSRTDGERTAGPDFLLFGLLLLSSIFLASTVKADLPKIATSLLRRF